jgi:hypothetical protein
MDLPLRWFLGPMVILGAIGCSPNPQVMPGGGSANGAGGNGRAPDRIPPQGSGTGGAGGAGAGAGGGPGSGLTPNGGKNCGFKNYVLERKEARLLLVLDRSGSMREPIGGGGGDKWTAAIGATREVIMNTQGAVNWGLKTFPDELECSVPDGVEVPIAANNFMPIDAAIGIAQPTGIGTPTTAAIRAGAAYLQSLPDGAPRYLVLATDGMPNCMDGMTSQFPDAPGAVAAIREAATQGFHTFVIGVAIAGTMGNATLNEMAVAGLEPRPGDLKYYAAASRADLVSALDIITGTVSNCVFPLGDKPPSPDDVAVFVDGARIPRDPSHMNGWDYATEGSVQLYGMACEKVKAAATPKVEIIFGCPGVVIP